MPFKVYLKIPLKKVKIERTVSFLNKIEQRIVALRNEL